MLSQQAEEEAITFHLEGWGSCPGWCTLSILWESKEKGYLDEGVRSPVLRPFFAAAVPLKNLSFDTKIAASK